MTVGIAAICQYLNVPLVLVAADRMVTSGDIEYEPFRTKMYPLSGRVFALIAGDVVAQGTICGRTYQEFKGKTNPRVQEVADSYAEQLQKYRLEHNVTKLLSPIGMTLKDFHQKLTKEDSQFARDMVGRFYEAELGVETIVAGTDDSGPHIFVIRDPGEVEDHSQVGFAAIGGGDWHAQSEFMLNGYVREWPLPWTLFLIYAAARRAQVAPGVGKLTIDIVSINGGSYTWVSTDEAIFKSVTGAYDKYQVREATARLDAYQAVEQTIQEHMERVSKQEQEKPQGSDVP